MKKISLTLIALCLFVLQIFAQAPQSFKYQSVVRDANGNAMQNQTVDFRISILQTTSNGTPVYVETFSTTTNDFGLVNLEIGTGTVLSGTFSLINWGADKYFLQVELDPDGNGYQLMGVSQLLSVPYALNAGNVNNNDTSTTNELQTISKSGSTVTLSNGGGSFIDEVNDNDADSTNEIQAISFSGDTLYLSNGNSVYLGNYSNIWQQNGNDIYYNNGYVGVGLTDPHGKLIVKGDASIPADSAIFEVRNKDGQVVFAVYQEGVRIYVDDTGTKAISSKGGFAVGGFNATKSLTNEYMRVTPDSVRIYIEENSGSKSITTKGGFAVGGFNATKTTPTDYFNISASDSAGTIPMPGEARVMWYPLKEAFLVGRVVIEQADSVGLNSFATGFQSKALGNYSQAFGYKARAKGNNSTAIGYYANAIGNNSYAFGNYSTAIDSSSYAIGSGAQATGLRSFAIGSTGIDSAGTPTSPTIASGDYSYAFGMGSVANNQGAFAIGTQAKALGNFSFVGGYKCEATDWYSVAIGYKSEATGYASIAIGTNDENLDTTLATGDYAIAIGRNALSSSPYSLAIGFYSQATAENAATFGAWNHATANAAQAFGYSSSANGEFSIAAGYNSSTSGKFSTAVGSWCITSEESAFAFGYSAHASGKYSLAGGNHATASGYDAVAIGTYAEATNQGAMSFGGYAHGNSALALGTHTYAEGSGSSAIGNSCHAIGWQSTAIGVESYAGSYRSFVIGSYSEYTGGDTSSWVSTDPLFIIGNGTTNVNRHNALTMLKNGNMGLNTNTPDKLLTVNGDARVTGDIYYGIIGSGTTYSKPDFVFKPDYNKDFEISDIEKFIKRHGHLPWVTAAKDEKNGINITRMSFETLEAVENQQLQIIQLKKENRKLKKEKDQQINKLRKENKELLKRIEKIEKQLKTRK